MPLRNYLQLIRAPNVFTAVTNIFTGFAAVSGANLQPRALALLALSSACLYTGGIALNDYCDLDVDRVERPQRPLPSGAIRPVVALALALGLLAMGVVFAAFVNPLAALAAWVLLLLVSMYDVRWKKLRVLGPVNMGACRFTNVFLGACAVPESTLNSLPFAGAMMLWVIAITVISRREVKTPHLQTWVKSMVLAIPMLDGCFVALLTQNPWLGLAVGAFSLPAWFLSRWLYVT